MRHKFHPSHMKSAVESVKLTPSPASFSCGRYSPLSDIFACGVILYRLLTGRVHEQVVIFFGSDSDISASTYFWVFGHLQESSRFTTTCSMMRYGSICKLQMMYVPLSFSFQFLTFLGFLLFHNLTEQNITTSRDLISYHIISDVLFSGICKKWT